MSTIRANVVLFLLIAEENIHNGREHTTTSENIICRNDDTAL